MARVIRERQLHRLVVDARGNEYDSDIGRAAVLRVRLGLALELIDDVAPRVGVRLRRDVSAILLWRAGGSAFNTATRTIRLDIGWSMVGAVEDLAIALVHEATHARQRAMGLRTRTSGEFVRRKEAHAVAETIDFAQHLEAGPWTMPSLAALETEWWSPEQKAERALKFVEDVGLPVAPVRVVLRVVRMVGLAR
jgi:hypothetical protein